MSLREKDSLINKLIWNEEMDVVYGEKNEFCNKDEFISRVKTEFFNLTGLEASICDLKVKSCICTKAGLTGDCIVPISDTDIEIKIFFIAQVEHEETV